MFAFLSPTIFSVAVSWELIWTRPAVDVDHFLLAQKMIGALREAGFKEESPGEQGRESLEYCEKGASYGYIQEHTR